MKIEEINKKQIWEVIRPISKLQEDTEKLYSECKENLNSIRELILNASSKIKFEEKEHRYFYDGEECIPVSKVIDFFIQETDFDKVAQNYCRKNNLIKPWQEVRQEWTMKGVCSTTNGTFVHQYGEDLTKICNINSSFIGDVSPHLKEFCEVDNYYIPIHPKQIAIYKYFEYCLSNKEIPFLAEIKLVLDKYKISGTFDQLVYSIPKKGFVIRDYKTNETLTKSFVKPMLKPFELYNDEALSHYIIQQNIYSLMLREIGVEVLGKELVWVKENGQFELISLPNLEKQVLKAIENL